MTKTKVLFEIENDEIIGMTKKQVDNEITVMTREGFIHKVTTINPVNGNQTSFINVNTIERHKRGVFIKLQFNDGETAYIKEDSIYIIEEFKDDAR